MSGDELMAVVTFGIMLMGAMAGVWWRIEGRIDRAKEEAVKKATEAAVEVDGVRAELAAHRLHTAETYVSKQGLRETTDQIMAAIHGVKQAVDLMAVRVDRVVENQSPRSTPRSAARG